VFVKGVLAMFFVRPESVVNHATRVALAIALVVSLSACEAPKGSYEWCEKIAHKDKSTWSEEDVAIFEEDCDLS